MKSGINAKYKLTDSLSTDFNLERVKSIGTSEYRSDVGALALKFEPSDRLGTSIKYERRRQGRDYTKHLGIYDIRGGGAKRKVPHFDDLLFLGGTPYSASQVDLAATYQSTMGGLVSVMSASNGAKVGQCDIEAPPVWDGMAAANGRLYISLENGSLLALKGK